MKVPELGTSLFILPNNDRFETRNSQERIVVLNAIARRIIDEQRASIANSCSATRAIACTTG